MFGLFGKRKAPPSADCVWRSDAARLRGICREVGGFVEDGSSVLVVALTVSVLDRLAEALADRAPLRAASVFERDELRERLGRAGTVSVALASALVPEAKPGGGDVRVDILVAGRHDARAADDAIVRFAESIAAGGFATFHLSLEDPLLAAHAGNLGPMLDKLGMTDDEPISHAFVSRAIENAQA
jgi:preprotein translocase subunit SecA